MVKNPPANAGDTGSIPGLGRSPGEANGNPFQYFCPGNPMDKGGWRATVHGFQRVIYNRATEHNVQSRLIKKSITLNLIPKFPEST